MAVCWEKRGVQGSMAVCCDKRGVQGSMAGSALRQAGGTGIYGGKCAETSGGYRDLWREVRC